jgi:hypothetical protein
VSFESRVFLVHHSKLQVVGLPSAWTRFSIMLAAAQPASSCLKLDPSPTTSLILNYITAVHIETQNPKYVFYNAPFRNLQLFDMKIFIRKNLVRFQVLTVATVKIRIWNIVVSCSLVEVNQR